MSRWNAERGVIAVALLLTARAVAACCSSTCDEPTRVGEGRYRLEARDPKTTTRESRKGIDGTLSYDSDAGAVIITRADGGSVRTERWRVASRKVDEDPRYDFQQYDAGAR